MYQQSKNCPFTEEDLTKLTQSFEETVTRFELDSKPIELNLEKYYLVNYACIWNKVKNVGRHCRIIQKNDKLCLVIFKNDSLTEDKILENLYRIEDLSVID